MSDSFSSPLRQSLTRRRPYSRHNRSSHSSNNSTQNATSNIPRLKLIPRPYNPKLPVNDEFYGTDPRPEACDLYLKQAQQLWQQKQLATFDRGGESYVRWIW